LLEAATGNETHPELVAFVDKLQDVVGLYVNPPTSASWLNAVKGFFAKRTKRRLTRGVFHSVVDLQAAINRFIDEHNKEPKPFIWTADPNEIIAAVNRGHQTLRTHH